MKYYELLNTTLGGRRQVGITREEKERIGIGKQDDYFDSFMDITSKFTLGLWFSDFKTRELEDPGFCSIHTWRGNVLFDPPLSGQPWGYIMVMDVALQMIISQFTLPSHRFYPVTVENIDTQEKREYAIFQITSDKYKELYYPEVTFVEIKNNQVLNTIEPGVINNVEDFERQRSLLMKKDTRIELLPKNILFRRYFDVVWGDSGEILFSEGIKNAIEKANPREVHFEPYKQNIEFKN